MCLVLNWFKGNHEFLLQRIIYFGSQLDRLDFYFMISVFGHLIEICETSNNPHRKFSSLFLIVDDTTLVLVYAQTSLILYNNPKSFTIIKKIINGLVIHSSGIACTFVFIMACFRTSI